MGGRLKPAFFVVGFFFFLMYLVPCARHCYLSAWVSQHSGSTCGGEQCFYVRVLTGELWLMDANESCFTVLQTIHSTQREGNRFVCLSYCSCMWLETAHLWAATVEEQAEVYLSCHAKGCVGLRAARVAWGWILGASEGAVGWQLGTGNTCSVAGNKTARWK